jgi:chromate transporter
MPRMNSIVGPNKVTVNVTFNEALRVWARIGCLSFGGPAGQIALMHREIVEERQWLTEKDYLAALNFCMLLPGPEAMQLATYAGWKLHGIRGGLAAGLLFVLPGALDRPSAHHALLQAFGNVAAGSMRSSMVSRPPSSPSSSRRCCAWRGVRSRPMPTGSSRRLAFLALYCLRPALPAHHPWPQPSTASSAAAASARSIQGNALPTLSALLPGTVGIWGVDLAICPLRHSRSSSVPHHVLTEIGVFFSKLAIVTFGGAYAVLTYMAQAAVEQKGWLTAPEMIDGLALAETTPGPLILVTQFVGYVAALREMGSIWGGIAGAVVTLWMTFAPCFLWIFAGAPYIDAIGNRPRLAGALAAITAAVVGVILNLSVWFGLHVLFGKVERLQGDWFQPWLPDWINLDWFALALSLLAALALLRFHLGIVKTLVLCAVIGAAWRLLS